METIMNMNDRIVNPEWLENSELDYAAAVPSHLRSRAATSGAW